MHVFRQVSYPIGGGIGLDSNSLSSEALNHGQNTTRSEHADTHFEPASASAGQSRTDRKTARGVFLAPFFIALILLLLFVATNVSGQEVLSYGKGSRIAKFYDGPMTASQREMFEKWKKQSTYFGAFLILTDSDKGLGVGGFSNPNTANNGILTECEVFLKKKSPGKCLLVASVFPVGYRSDNASKTNLNYAAGQAFLGKYKPRQEDGKFGAFAAAGIGFYGYSWGANSEKRARRLALRQCKKANQAGRFTKKDPVSAVVAQMAGGLECKIVHLTTP